MTHSHTPGPWKICEDEARNSDSRIYIIDEYSESYIAIANNPYSEEDELNHSNFAVTEMLANAHLIAAAPKLLRMLEKLMRSQWLSIDKAGNRTPEAVALRVEACKAIDKARGINHENT